MNPRELLLHLRMAGIDDSTSRHRDDRHRAPTSHSFGTLPPQPVRPLGAFSDFVCDELGTYNKLLREKSISSGELFDLGEAKLAAVADGIFNGLIAPECQTDRRLALLDLVWMLRSLDIAHKHDRTYLERKRNSHLFHKAEELAGRERRHPTLLWSDIAIHHPVHDPRTFLEPGRGRDEEILMYRVQCGIELTFKRAIESNWNKPTTWTLAELFLDLDAALKGIMHYSRVRTLGQFYQLDPFLGPNSEYRGHATGSFSAWTYLMGVFLAENREFAKRLCDSDNHMAFDPDAAPYVRQVAQGSFTPLGRYLENSQLTARRRAHLDRIATMVRRRFTLFLHSHRGAIKRHAPAAFQDESPSDPPKKNDQTIREAIDGMSPQPTVTATDMLHGCAGS